MCLSISANSIGYANVIRKNRYVVSKMRKKFKKRLRDSSGKPGKTGTWQQVPGGSDQRKLAGRP